MGPRPHNNVLEEASSDAPPARVSAELDGWLRAEPDPTLGGLVAAFGHKSFAIVFMLLLGVPALPLPTGGAAPPLGLVAIVLALGLLARGAGGRVPRRRGRLRVRGPARGPLFPAPAPLGAAAARRPGATPLHRRAPGTGPPPGARLPAAPAGALRPSAEQRHLRRARRRRLDRGVPRPALLRPRHAAGTGSRARVTRL